MNGAEVKRLEMLNKRLRSVNPNKKVDFKHRKQRCRNENELEVCSVETERINNTARRSNNAHSSGDRLALAVRNRPRAISLRTRNNSNYPKQENCNMKREISDAPRSNAASLWSHVKNSSASLVEEELSKRAASRYRPVPNKLRSQALPSASEKSVSCLSLDAATAAYNKQRIRPRAILSRRSETHPQDSELVDLSAIPSSGHSQAQGMKRIPLSDMSSSRSLYENPSDSLERNHLSESSPSTDSSISTLVSTLKSLLRDVQDTNRSSESYTVCCTILEQVEKSHAAEVSSLSHQIEKWQKLYVDELVSNNSSEISNRSLQTPNEKSQTPAKDSSNSLKNPKKCIAQSA